MRQTQVTPDLSAPVHAGLIANQARQVRVGDSSTARDRTSRQASRSYSAALEEGSARTPTRTLGKGDSRYRSGIGARNSPGLLRGPRRGRVTFLISPGTPKGAGRGRFPSRAARAEGVHHGPSWYPLQQSESRFRSQEKQRVHQFFWGPTKGRVARPSSLSRRADATE
jgi:hypothetical protein